MPNTHTTLGSLFSDIADAIRAKTGGQSDIVADEFPTAIGAIPTGTDVSDTTAVAGDVLSGKFFYLANGTKTQGTIASYDGAVLETMTIDGVEYNFVVDSTWAQWVTSAYNTGGFTSSSGNVYTSSNKIVQLNGVDVSSQDDITATDYESAAVLYLKTTNSTNVSASTLSVYGVSTTQDATYTVYITGSYYRTANPLISKSGTSTEWDETIQLDESYLYIAMTGGVAITPGTVSYSDLSKRVWVDSFSLNYYSIIANDSVLTITLDGYNWDD